MKKITILFLFSILIIGLNGFSQSSTNKTSRNIDSIDNLTTEKNNDTMQTDTAKLDKTVVKKSSKDTNDKNINKVGICLFIAVIVLLIIYIIAVVRTRKGLMYTFANWWDFILVLIAGFIITIVLSYMNANQDYDSATH